MKAKTTSERTVSNSMNQKDTSGSTPITRSPDHQITRSEKRLSRALSTPLSLVVYITCGDPDLATTRDIVHAAIGAGADVIELGVPFSDPVADGPVIQRASERALRNRTSLEDVLRLAGEIRKDSNAGLVVFSYLN